MAYYYSGYSESRDKLQDYTDAQLLDLLDALYGRERLGSNYSREELLSEALRQHREEWTDKSSTAYDQVQFYIKLARSRE